MRSPTPPIAAALAGAPVLLAALLGNAATIPNIEPWYDSLAKPPLTPPNWVFGPVWTLLYALMALAFYWVLRSERTDGRPAAILLFACQLFLNAGWSFAFFGAQSPTLGLAVILPMEALILATVWTFWRLDRAAAFCLVPYALWVGFAVYLNAGILALNL